MIVERTIAGQLNAEFYKGKIAISYGARQVGKTTLVRELQKAYPDSVYLNCDEPDIAASLTGKTSTELLKIFGNSKMVFIDEAQRVENIGLSLKLIADNRPDIQVVATGSSSSPLNNRNHRRSRQNRNGAAYRPESNIWFIPRTFFLEQRKSGKTA